MYTIVDGNAVHNILHRVWAEKELAERRASAPEGDWKLVVEVKPSGDNALERLYALAAVLINESKVNPLAMQLSVGDVGGSDTGKQYSAVEVMNMAREVIDGMGEGA